MRFCVDSNEDINNLLDKENFDIQMNSLENGDGKKLIQQREEDTNKQNDKEQDPEQEQHLMFMNSEIQLLEKTLEDERIQYEKNLRASLQNQYKVFKNNCSFNQVRFRYRFNMYQSSLT